MCIEWKVKICSEQLLIQQLFTQGNISHKTKQWPICPHSHPDGSTRHFFRGLKRQKSLGVKPVDERDTSIKIAATELPSVGLCGVLVPSDFHLFSCLQKHIGGHSCQTDAEVQDAVLQRLCLQNPEFCAEGMHSLMTHCAKCLNLQGDYRKLKHCCVCLVRKVILHKKLISQYS